MEEKEEVIIYTLVLHQSRKKLGLTLAEYCVADSIYHLSSNPKSEIKGWCYASKETLGSYLNLTDRTIWSILNKLIERKVIEKHKETKGFLRTTQLWYDTVVMTRMEMRMNPEETSGSKKKSQINPEETSGKTLTKLQTIKISNKDNIKKIGLDKPTARKNIKFPKEDYNKVIKNYELLKEVKFSGKEYEPIQQAIKTMFMSDRSAKDIIRCMEWFAEKSNSDEKKYIWTKNWTINTIKIKLAEFLAGKLGENEELIIPSYAKEYVK